jgi:hypothetical protein
LALQHVTGRSAPFRESQRKTVQDIAADELEVRVVGRTVEPRHLELAHTELSSGRDPVLSIDDTAIRPIDEDRRPARRNLGQGRDV